MLAGQALELQAVVWAGLREAIEFVVGVVGFAGVAVDLCDVASLVVLVAAAEQDGGIGGMGLDLD